VRVTVNGASREITPGTTVAMLVAELVHRGRGTAVAVNEEVVPRSAWGGAELRPDDRVEVLIASQGG
jgi:sulfur carrier protein